jgi:hypothetical protein
MLFRKPWHKKSLKRLISLTQNNPELWDDELINRIGKTITKGRFAQELSSNIDKHFVVPEYISQALSYIAKCKNITLRNA